MNQYSKLLLYLESLSDEELNNFLALKDLENKNENLSIEDLLLNLKHNPANLGFNYMVKAIEVCLENEDALKSITKILYPTIARKTNSTASRVERYIRHTIETSWDKISSKQREEIFFNQSEKPSNSEYIAYLYKYINGLKKQQTYQAQKVLR